MVLDHCPSPPDWHVDWEALRATYAWVDALHACPQDATYHAEGDVGIHTRMACEILAASPSFQALDEPARQVVFAGLLLHDVAKPACTRTQDGRLTARGHSRRGEVMARELLWKERVAFRIREAICGLVRYHQVPFFLIEQEDCARTAFAISQAVRCDWLSLVAWADGAGRRCAKTADQTRILDNVELFREFCAEQDCLTHPRSFPSDHSRFRYFQGRGRDPNYQAFDDTQCEVTVMAGLPASGKDYWIERNVSDLPLVSLDGLRAELKVDPSESQGRVIDEARKRARALLRERRPFVWNATNMSLTVREPLVTLLAGYRARIRIVYLEASPEDIARRNAARPDPVPRRAIDKMMSRWTVPTLCEAHEVSVVLT